MVLKKKIHRELSKLIREEHKSQLQITTKQTGLPNTSSNMIYNDILGCSQVSRRDKQIFLIGNSNVDHGKYRKV